MPHRKDHGNMRLNHDEENILGQGECQGVDRSKVDSAPAEKTPTRHHAHASGKGGGHSGADTGVDTAGAKVAKKACRHHIDETLGGAHHD